MLGFKNRVIGVTETDPTGKNVVIDYVDQNGQQRHMGNTREEDWAPEGLIKDLFGEKEVLLAMMKELLCQRGIKLMGAGDFTREVHNLAKKIGSDPQCVRIILTELVRELTKGMLIAPVKQPGPDETAPAHDPKNVSFLPLSSGEGK